MNSSFPAGIERSTPLISLPSVFTARPEARRRMRDFFSSHIRNPHIRRAYREAVRQFSAFCAEYGTVDLGQVNRSTSRPLSRRSCSCTRSSR